MGHQHFMKSLRLDQITLVSASSIHLPETELALMISMHDIEFGEVKLLTSEDYMPKNSKVQVIKIPKLDFWNYSIFIANQLHQFIDTDYCLVVQADGFVLNANKWQNEFLNYDYIGAPWPKVMQFFPSKELLYLKNQVGNGGFSLRSKKMLKESAKINFSQLKLPTISEDIILCHYFYEAMIKGGIKFPPPELAAKFSIESENASYGQTPKTTFGFHGKELRDLIFNSMHRNA